jgi:predicted glycosyltransferase
VLVTPGGGEDGYALVDHALRAWPACRPNSARACTWSAGRRWRRSQRAAVGRRPALPGVSLQDFSDDMMSLQAAADVVLAMGGYNTVCELLTLRQARVLVPRVKPGQEQCIRAERMVGLGLVRMLHPDQLTPATLMRAVQAELAAAAPGPAAPAPEAAQGPGADRTSPVRADRGPWPGQRTR